MKQSPYLVLTGLTRVVKGASISVSVTSFADPLEVIALVCSTGL